MSDCLIVPKLMIHEVNTIFLCCCETALSPSFCCMDLGKREHQENSLSQTIVCYIIICGIFVFLLIIQGFKVGHL